MKVYKISLAIITIIVLLLAALKWFVFGPIEAVRGAAQCPPRLPFEVVLEEGMNSKHSKDIIVILPKEHYTEPNLKHIFLCFSQQNPEPQLLIIRVFTNKSKATPRNFYMLPGWRHFVSLYPYDATFIRADEIEKYEYRPVLWLPFFLKKVTLSTNVK